MTAAPTPGPWHVGGKALHRIVYAADGLSVADCLHYVRPAAVQEANAYAIAQLPDLVAALETCLRHAWAAAATPDAARHHCEAIADAAMGALGKLARPAPVPVD